MSDIGIYKITNTANGKVYIGQSTQLFRRLDSHQVDLKNNHHHNQHLQNSYNKYGDVFEIEIIKYCNDESELDDLERYYIEYYDAMNPTKGYNKESGGHLNKHLSEETKKKISDSQKGEKNHMFGKKGKNNPNYGRTHSEETKKKISDAKKGKNNPMFGKTHTEEAKKKISKAHKGKTHSEEAKKKMSENNARYWKGKIFPEEVRKKMSNAQKGKTLSEETRKKISESRKGQSLSEETKRKLSEIHNTSGFYRVNKKKDNSCKQNFLWCYRYYINDKRKEIKSTNLLKLKDKVEVQGLPWKIIDEEKAKESLELNNKYHKGEYK